MWALATALASLWLGRQIAPNFLAAPSAGDVPRASRASRSLRLAADGWHPHLASPERSETETNRWGSLAQVVLLAAFAVRTGANRQGHRKKVARQANLVASRPDQAIPWYDRRSRLRLEEGIGIWAEKVNCTPNFYEEDGLGKMGPSTILAVKRGGNYVVGKKWPEKHGRYAIQVAYDRFVPDEEEVKGFAAHLSMLKMAGVPPLKKVRDFNVRPQDWGQWEVGQRLWASDIFKVGDKVDVMGWTQEKGFCSRIKKFHWHQRGPYRKSSKHHRRIGSVNQAGAQRVYPGRAMPGHAGGVKKKSKNLEIIRLIDHIDEDNMPETLIVVKGHVAGFSAYGKMGGSYVYITHRKTLADGRKRRDSVAAWNCPRDKDPNYVDDFTRLPGGQNVWYYRTIYGREIRWLVREVKRYWPDGFPGYDHTADPYYDDCDTHLAMKAPEW